MKYLSQLVVFPILILAFGSCEKEENKIYYEGGTPPVLTASATDISLEPGQESNLALALTWTNPNYQFTTGTSSHDVTYTLEIDTAGANFNSSKKYTSVIAKEMSKSYTVAELNGILGNDMLLQLNPRRDYAMELRIISSIGSGAKLISNVVSFTTKPFAPPPKVELPSTGQLFLVGDASPGGWANPVPTPSQEFTKVSDTFYELTINLTGGKSLLFLPLNGDWGDKYGWDGSNNANKPDGDVLKRGGGDIKTPAADGTYKISVNFQLGVFSIVKQ
jgi:hypothetical protein